jgi:LPXTG-motif cell wall-anchored protein
MSQNTRGRVAATTGLAVVAVSLGMAFAPAALAAPSGTAAVSATTLAPGAEFTITGTGCLPGTTGENGTAVFLPAVDPQWGDAIEAETDGTWTLVETAPTELGTYEYANFCDSYGAGFDYPNIVITVTADGKPATAAPVTTPVDAVRGTAANTPGIAANRATTAASDKLAAPGEKVVRVYRGFQPLEVVRVTLHSTPQNVGTFTADAAGVLTVSFTVPAGTPVSDDHTLVLVGDKGSYFQESFEVAAVGDARLADTGASVTVPLVLGAGFLLAGGGLVVATRRRAPGALQA